MLEFGLLLELVSEIEEAAGWSTAFAKEMRVVGHETIGVDRKG